MSIKNKMGEPEGTPTPTPSEAESNSNHTINPNKARQAFQSLCDSLPPEISQKLDNVLRREMANHFQQKGDQAKSLDWLPPLKTTPSAQILKTNYPDSPWLVSDYLGPGLTFLYGKPKVGKSWLALQMALSVLVGGKMFGRDIPQGRVLYLALEDSERRLKNRMKAQGWPSETSVDFALYDDFLTDIESLNSKGGKLLMAQIETKKYALVLIDTFSRAIMGDQLKSDEMTKAISPLQQYAMKKDISLVIIDHEPKGGSTLFGSVAKLGIADTFWRLYKERGVQGAKLSVMGRDLEKEYTLKLIFDTQGHFWHCEGDAHKIEITQRRAEIIEALETLGEARLKEINEMIGQDRSNTYKRLQDLANEGLIVKTKKGRKAYYSLPE
jgi:RecA-family ATPase